MRSRSLPMLPLLFVLAASSCGYNTIQTMDERAAQAKKQIEVQLQRRADLVGNLVNTVKGYAAHEEAVFTNVAQARAGLAGAVARGDPKEMAQANEQMTGALGRLLVIANSEAYPQLKADQGFLRLQMSSRHREPNRGGRTDYNEMAAVQHVHPPIPGCAHSEGDRAKPREYFECDPASLEARRLLLEAATKTP